MSKIVHFRTIYGIMKNYDSLGEVDFIFPLVFSEGLILPERIFQGISRRAF
jgi:hypothetical protein